jgi:hypothetical protein
LPWSEPIIVAVFPKSQFDLPGAVCSKQAGATVGHHVTVYVTNPKSAHIATEAMLDRTLIAISSDITEDVDIIIGFVQSIEEDADAVPRRWRITILETDDRPIGTTESVITIVRNRAPSSSGGAVPLPSICNRRPTAPARRHAECMARNTSTT